MMRLFIAVPVTDSLKELLLPGIKQAKTADADIKWVAGENLHLTLKFLGDQPESLLSDLISELKQVAQTHSQFALKFTDVGFFPQRSRPRVIWLGINGEMSLLDKLALSIDKGLELLKLAPENKRKWHLTLGRVRSERNLDILIPQLASTFASLQGQVWPVNRFILYQSTLTPKGPIYKELEVFNLR